MPPQITSYGRPIAIISSIGSVVAAGHWIALGRKLASSVFRA
ncbi:hypothetical protein [Streptomyces globisporus]